MKGKHGHKHHRSKGGKTEDIDNRAAKASVKSEETRFSPAYDVLKEAKERKHGGAMHHEGKKAHHRRDRKHRATGGRAGSDKNPLSSAHKTSGAGADA
jgi:hypothetical protein